MQTSHVPSSQIVSLLEDAGSGLRTWLAPAPKDRRCHQGAAVSHRDGSFKRLCTDP